MPAHKQFIPQNMTDFFFFFFLRTEEIRNMLFCTIQAAFQQSL